jgi:hypothetical protein
MANELWTQQKKLRAENDKNWAELYVKNDSGIDSFHVFIGIKEKEPHIHMGFNIQLQLVVFEPRDMVATVRKKVESAQQGLLQDLHRVFDETLEELATFEMKGKIELSTGEVKIESFGWRQPVVATTAS